MRGGEGGDHPFARNLDTHFIYNFLKSRFLLLDFLVYNLEGRLLLAMGSGLLRDNIPHSVVCV